MSNFCIKAFLCFLAMGLGLNASPNAITSQKSDTVAPDELQQFDDRQDQLIKFEEARKKFEKEQEQRVKEQRKRINDATVLKELEQDIDSVDWASKEQQFPTLASYGSIKELYLRMLRNAQQELTDPNLEAALSWSCDSKKMPVPTRLEFILYQVDSILNNYGIRKNEPFVHVTFGAQKLLQCYLLTDILCFLGFSEISLVTIGASITKNRLYHLNLLLSLTYPTDTFSTTTFSNVQDFIATGVKAHSFDTINPMHNANIKVQQSQENNIIKIFDVASKQELVSIIHNHNNFYLIKDPQLPGPLYHTIQQSIDAGQGLWNKICAIFSSPLQILYKVLHETVSTKLYSVVLAPSDQVKREFDFIELVEQCSIDDSSVIMILSESTIVTLNKTMQPVTNQLEAKKPKSITTIAHRA